MTNGRSRPRQKTLDKALDGDQKAIDRVHYYMFLQALYELNIPIEFRKFGWEHYKYEVGGGPINSPHGKFRIFKVTEGETSWSGNYRPGSCYEIASFTKKSLYNMIINKR